MLHPCENEHLYGSHAVAKSESFYIQKVELPMYGLRRRIELATAVVPLRLMQVM
jgi:hypothetical protein